MHSAQRCTSGFGNNNRKGGGAQIFVSLMLLISILCSAAISFAASELPLFGPKRYERAQGKPWVFTDSFNGCANSAGQARIKIQNGDNRDSSLTSALITLNGANVFVEGDFKNQTLSLERMITINPGSNSLTTQLKSGGQKATPFLVVTVLGIGCDSTPPLITNPQPVAGALLAIARPVISASYSDNSGGAGIDTASVRVTLDGGDITSSCSVTASGVSCTAADLPEGTHNVSLNVADLLQNPATLVWRFSTDTVAPSAAITTPADNIYLNARSVTATGTIDDPAAQITVNGKSAIINGTLFSVTDLPLAEGANTLTVTASDQAGNRTQSSITVTVDTALPVVTITAPLEGDFTNIPSVTVSGTVSEPPVSVLVNGRAAVISGKTFALADLPLAEGLNSLNVAALDLAGNRGSAIVTVNLDTVKPQIFIATPADRILTRASQLTVSGTVSEPLTSLTINGAGVVVAPDLSYTTTLTLVEGVNSIILEATDRGGNKGTASVSVTLDSTPPVAPTLESLNTPTNQPLVTVSGSAEPWSSVALFNGSERVATIVTPEDGRFSFKEVTLHDGDNSFSVTSLDAAGNQSAPSIPVTVLLDTKAPVVAITTPLDKAILNAPTITVTGSIDDPAAQVTVNGLPALNSGGIWTVEGFTLQEGSNTLLVEARDPAGNKGSATASVLLDTVLPVVTVSAPLDGLYTNIKTQAVSGTINEAVASVTVNGQPATVNASASTYTLSGLQLVEGINSISVEATDLAGNKGNATVTVTLDTIAPQLTVIGPADGALLNNGQITFGGSAGEPVTQVTVNGVAAQAGSNGGYTLPVTLAEGSNSLTVTATDRAGNSSTSSINVNLDSTAPVAPLLDPLVTPTRTAVTTVSGQAEANATVKLFNNGGLIATLTADGNGLFSVANVTLTEGSNPFTAQATDAAGNTSPLSVPLTLLLDTKAPVITVTAPQTGAVISAAQVTIIGTVDETLASLTVNGAATPLGSLTFEYILTLAAGENSALITATDLAGNVATTTIIIQRDSTPPKVVIVAPLNGLLTNSPQIQVSGTVDDAEAAVTLGGAAVTVANKAFSVGYVLSDGDNSIQAKAIDKAGNEGTAAVTVTLDAQAPVVTLNAPATATAGTDVQISVNATDNRGLTLVDVSADGASLWSVAPNAATASQNISMRLSPTLTPGATVTVRGRALDAAGNSGSATAIITIDKGADGPGWLQGKVLDDSRGLPLAGVQVSVTDSKGVQQGITTTADGAWFFELASGAANVGVIKSGFTTVHRDVTVRPGQRTSVLDSRLTKLDVTAHPVDATGGVAKSSPFKIQNSSFTIDVSISAEALSAQTDVRLTPVSNQGVIAPLPLGWSPLAVVDLRLLDPVTAAPIDPQPLTAPATLTLPLPTGLGDSALTAQLARYDSSSRRWLAVAEVAVAAKATTTAAQINQPGQYALLLADPAPLNPPVPATGQQLAAVTIQPSDFSLISTTGRVVPQAAPPSVGLRAAGDLLLVAKPDAATAPALTSGLVVNARVSEKFDLTGGSTLQPAATLQDIVLYRTPCATSIAGGATEPLDATAGLRTTFPVAPSRDFTIVDLLLGKITVEITPPDTSGGVMVGADGARLLQPDGTSLSIPAGALTGSVPVTVATLPETTVSSLVGADFRLLRGVDVAITGQTLKSGATLSIPAPAGFDPALPVVVAKKFDVKGGSRLKLVAVGKLSGSIISSDATFPAGNETMAAQGVTTSGQYLFLQAIAPIGYVTGQITDAAAAPFAGIQVSAHSATLADLTGVNGQYLLALAAGSQAVTALDPTRGDAASGSVAIAANSKNILNLTVRMVSPTVLSISPANGAANVRPTVPVVVTFSKPMDKNLINSQTLKLTDSTGTEIPGVLTFNVDNTAVTFYPSDAFKQETKYSVTIGASVKDVQGYPLGQDVVSSFIVRRTTAPPMPAAGAISGTFPDADGYITVTATQGSAEAGNTVLLINDTTGEIQSVTPQSNGSFTGKVRGQLGDEIKVVLMDYSGNQTTISYITFKNSDGSYLVTAKGGRVEGEGGSLLEIPDGALVGATVVKVTPLLQTALPSPLQTPGTFLSAFNVDSGGLNFQKEVHLSIPVPSGFDPKTPVFVVKPGEVYNEDGTVEKVFEIVDSTKIINGRITTASPPFDGIMGFGSYIFTAFPEVQLGISSGYTYQEMNGLPGYQEAPSRAAWDELMPGTNPVDKMYKYDRPVQGAVIRTPAAWNYVSYSRSSGFYAGFSTLFGNVGAADLEYKLTATHPQTMRRESLTGYLSADGTSSRNIEKLNFKLADKDTVIPDKTAPAIDFGLQLAPGQGASAKLVSGTVTLGSDVQVAVSVIDQLVDKVFLTVEYKTAEMPTAVQTPVPLEPAGKVLYARPGPGSPAISRYSYTPAFAGDLKGSVASNFRPQQVGIYTFTVQATDMAGNTSNRMIELRAVAQGEVPAALDGPPFVLAVAPGDKSADIRIDTGVQAVFSELVANVNETTFKLFDKATLQPVSAEVSLSVDAGLVRAILTPRANLVYGREYLIRITTAITDATPNPSANGALLPLYREITATFTTSIPKAFDLSANPFSGGRDVALYTDLDKNRLYSYVTAGDQGWRAVDVTSADKPEVVWPRPDLGIPSADYKFPAGFVFRGVAVEQQQKLLGMTENITFADGNQYGYLRLYDLSDPKKPVVAGREVLSEAYTGIPGRLAMRGDYAYISTVGAGLQIVNTKTAIGNQTAGKASDGSAIVGAYDTISEFGHPNDIALSGATGVVLTTNSGFLLTFDVTTPEIPMVQGSSRPDGTWYQRVAMADDYVFTSAEGATGVMNLAVVGGRKSVAGLQEGRLFTLDLSDPGQPRQLGVLKDKDDVEVNVSVMDVSVNKSAGLAFVAGFVTSGGSTANAIQVVDIRDPFHPRLISTITQLPDMNAVVPPGGTRPMIPIGSTMALTNLNGWLYLANQPKGVRTLQLVDGPSLASRCDDCYNQIK